MLKNTTFFFSPPEVFRKSSLGNDETDKEKKKFLGFFKVNKRSSSKVIHHTHMTLWGIKVFLTIFID